MRRVEIIDACLNVLRTIELTGIENVLGMFFGPGRAEKIPETESLARLVSAFKKYTILSSNFGPLEKEIAKILEISELENAEFWSVLLHPAKDPSIIRENIYSVYSNLRSTRSFLPKFVTLIETKAIRSSDSLASKEQADKAGKGTLLSVIILEKEEEEISNADRLISVLQSIKALYEVAAKLEGVSESDLGVIGCDSGSDKSFDFIGSEKAIQHVKQIILSVWDRIIFYQEQKIEKRLDIITKTIPVIEEIKKRKKSLGAEQAMLLERAAMDGIKKFVEAGAMIPEIQERTSYSPRKLLAPQPKLLSHYGTTDKQTSTSKKKSPKTASDTKSPETPDDSLFEDLTDTENLELYKRLRELRNENADDTE